MHFLLLPSHYEEPASCSQNMLNRMVKFAFFHILIFLNCCVLCLLIYLFYNSEKSLYPSWALYIFHNSLLILVSVNELTMVFSY